jgi:lipid II:glycine glycyltransferase (peptidoglycan interpeptide bridge formation enzyme)
VAIPERAITSQAAYRFDPLQDSRWEEFLQWHPRASLFHSSAWLSALRATYGYQAVAYTTSRPGNILENAIVFCKVESWLTGRRLVSIPFADHAEPLVDAEGDATAIAAALEGDLERERWDYLETRPLQPFPALKAPYRRAVTYSYHLLDLGPGLSDLFDNLHKSSIQRKIRRAEREKLTYGEGTSPELLDHFYGLFLLTRRRHRLPPQPKGWFANLMKSFGKALKIRVAYKDDRPVAAVVTITHKDTMSYKYGASDARFNHFGGMPVLLWKAIEEAKARGFRFFDFGRTNADQTSLMTFKNRWGTAESVLTYSRYSASERAIHFFDSSQSNWKANWAKYVLSHLPQSIVSKTGEIFYRHAG